jgi:WD40 repeat protein
VIAIGDDSPEDTGTLELRSGFDGKLVASLRDEGNDYTTVCFSPDGRLVAGASWYGDVTVWDVERQSVAHRFHAPGIIFKTMVILDRGPTLLAGGGRWERGEIHCWDLASETKTQVVQDLGRLVVDMAVSPDGESVAIATWDGSVQLRRSSDLTLQSSFVGHRGWASSVSFSADGLRLASGGIDGQVRLWDLDTRRQLGGLLVDEWVTDVAFVDHGKGIAAGLADGSVVVWHVDGRRSKLDFGEQDGKPAE